MSGQERAPWDRDGAYNETEPVTYRRDDSKAPASLAPQPKVVAGGVAGALVVLLVWVASLFGLEVPDYVALAAVVVIGSGAAYLKRQ